MPEDVRTAVRERCRGSRLGKDTACSHAGRRGIARGTGWWQKSVDNARSPIYSSVQMVRCAVNVHREIGPGTPPRVAASVFEESAVVVKRTCELPFCSGIVEGSRNKHRCDNDRNIHLHQVISKNVKKIMRFIESRGAFTANEVNRELFRGRLDKNEKGSMYRLFQAMVREKYLVEGGTTEGLKIYQHNARGSGRRRGRPTRGTGERELDAAASRVAPTGTTDGDGPAVPREPELSPAEQLRAKLKEFVYLKQGAWNHDDWLWLVNRPDVRALGIDDAAVGAMLEDEKMRYWAQR